VDERGLVEGGGSPPSTQCLPPHRGKGDLGYPRIGSQRDLKKKASELHWSAKHIQKTFELGKICGMKNGNFKGKSALT